MSFFTIKHGTVTKKVKAGSFNELSVKAASRFGVNPNTMTLKFTDPDGEEMCIESDDNFEYIEHLLQEKSSKTNWSAKNKWRLIIMLEDSSVKPEVKPNVSEMNKHKPPNRSDYTQRQMVEMKNQIGISIEELDESSERSITDSSVTESDMYSDIGKTNDFRMNSAKMPLFTTVELPKH